MEDSLRILIVDDEPNIAGLLRVGLKYEGFSVAVADDGEKALQVAAQFKPHLVILDLMLPGLDGLDVARRLRRDPDTLIIMLTARDAVADRIAGLHAGGDDYVVKPFVFEELLARIHAVARRRLPERVSRLEVGPVALDQDRYLVTVHGRPVKLSLREYELLRLFLLHPRQVLSRQLILDRVWGYDFYGDENNVEVYVGYLRKKIGDDDRTLIETVRGIGYRLNP